jgi:ubiquinone/menaquinone biosynthesis C-methylase UbiE
MKKRPDAEESRRSRDFYDWWAPFYDASNRMAAWVRGASDSRERQRAIERLELRPGARVLEVSCGTGTNLPLLSDAVGDEGFVAGLDISGGMLARCERKLRRKDDYAYLLMADAAKQPFRDSSFDAVFHHGGIAEFPDKKRAIAEMARVVRPGGKVVICDAGLPQDRPARWINRQLLKLQPKYAAPPPVRLLPKTAQAVRVDWIRGDGWYLLEFVKASETAVSAGSADSA